MLKKLKNYFKIAAAYSRIFGKNHNSIENLSGHDWYTGERRTPPKQPERTPFKTGYGRDF